MIAGPELVAGAALGAVAGVAAEETIKPDKPAGSTPVTVTELAALITAVSELARIMDYTRPLPPSYMQSQETMDGNGDGQIVFPSLNVPVFLERISFAATTLTATPDIFAYVGSTSPQDLIGAANPAIGAGAIEFSPPAFLPINSPLIIGVDGASANDGMGIRVQYRVIPQHLYARLQSIEASR